MKKTFTSISMLLGLTAVSGSSIANTLIKNSGLAEVPITRFDEEEKIPETLTLKWADDRYAAHVDFVKGKDSERNMSIALYTSESLLVNTECEKMETYVCSQFEFCDKTAEDKTVEFPYYTAKGKTVKTNLFPDTTGLQVTKDASIVYADECTRDQGAYLHYVVNGTGIIGLGVKNNDKKLSLGNTFTLTYKEEKLGADAVIDFRNQSLETNEEYKVRHTLTADEDWHVNIQPIVHVGDTTIDLSSDGQDYKLIYDINFPYIGLPATMYVKVMEQLKKNDVLKCEHPSITGPSKCNTTYPNLPNITIQIDQKTNFTLMPEDYLNTTTLAKGKSDEQEVNITLVPTSSSADLRTFLVTPTYNNYIIIGSNPILDDTVVFDTEKHTITTYFKPPPAVATRVILIFAGLFGFALLVVLFDYFYLTKKLQKMKKAQAEGGDTAALLHN